MRNRLIPQLRVSSDLTAHTWVGSNPGQARINNYFFLEYMRTRSDVEIKISRTNSALSSSNSWITPKTYGLYLPNLVWKKQLWDISERHESFTSRSAEVIMDCITPVTHDSVPEGDKYLLCKFMCCICHRFCSGMDVTRVHLSFRPGECKKQQQEQEQKFDDVSNHLDKGKLQRAEHRVDLKWVGNVKKGQNHTERKKRIGQ